MPGITGSGKAASGTSPRVLREHPCLCASHRCKTKPRQAKIQEGRPKNVAKRRRRGQQTPGQRLQGQAQAKSPRAKGQRDSDTRKPRTTTRWQQRGLTARTPNLGRGAHYGSPIKTQGGDKPTGKWPNGPWQGKKPTGHKVAASRRHKGDSPSRTPPFTLRQCTGQPWGSGRGDTQPKVF